MTRLTRPLSAVALLGLLCLASALGSSRPAAAQDTTHDFVIASIGDSFNSGEGNPLVPGAHDNDGDLIGAPELWGPSQEATAAEKDAARRCHRSPNAYGARAATQLQQQFPNVNVKLVHVGCSGAQIRRSTPAALEEAGGLIEAYEGIEPAANETEALPPQVNQLNAALGLGTASSQRIDALVVHIGVNDIGFGDLVRDCVISVAFDCNTFEGTLERLNEDLTALPGKFEDLVASIRGARSGGPNLNEPPGQVYLVEYPDVTRDENGKFCDKTDTDPLYGRITAAEAKWAHDEILLPLNSTILGAVNEAVSPGERWSYLAGNLADFRTHGICSSDRYMLTNGEAVSRQGADALDLGPLNLSFGMAHPNGAGHQSVADRLAPAIAQQITEAFTPGIPTLSVGTAKAASGGVPGEIELRWNTPPTRAVENFELEVRSPTTPSQVLATHNVAGSARTFTHQADGVFLYQVRTCSPTECSAFSNRVRASNVPASEIGTPTDLERAISDLIQLPPGYGNINAGKGIGMTWKKASDKHAFFELDYRRLPDPQDRAGVRGAGKRLTGKRRDAVSRLQRRGGVSRLLGVLDASLNPFSTIRTIDDEGRVGSYLEPLSVKDSYELRVRACSNVGCTPYTGSVVEPVARPKKGDKIPIGITDNHQQQRAADEAVLARLGWAGGGPQGGNDWFRSVDLRFRGARGEVGRIHFDREAGELSLFGQSPRASGATASRRKPTRRSKRTAARRKRELRDNTGKPGAKKTLKSGPLRLSLRGSRAKIGRRAASLDLSLRAGSALAGEVLALEASVTDSKGRRQPFRRVGTLIVKERSKRKRAKGGR